MPPDSNLVVAVFSGPVPAAVSKTHQSEELSSSTIMLWGRLSQEQAINELRALAPEETPWIIRTSSAPVKLRKN